MASRFDHVVIGAAHLGDAAAIVEARLGADLTGTWIQADKTVAVFGGSEGSNVPDTNKCVIPPGLNQGTCASQGWPCTTNADCPVTCCADHLEEQLFPNETLGREVYLARMPWRSSAVDESIITGESIGRFEEPEYVRILAVESGTTLPAPTGVHCLAPAGLAVSSHS